MQDYFLKKAIFIVQDMIKKFFVDGDIDGLLNYCNKKNFSWIGSGENNFLSNFNEFFRYIKENKNDAAYFEIIDEIYNLSTSSQDSCLVTAKIKFQHNDKNSPYQSMLYASFYLQIVNGELLVSHYHIHSPIKLCNDNEFIFVNLAAEENQKNILPNVRYQNETMRNFLDVNTCAAKSFFYEENLPYRSVNQKFLQMLGYKKIKNFFKDSSSLVHIYLADQPRYIEFLHQKFDEILKSQNISADWKFQTSYHLIYKISAFGQPPLKVLEWGNLFTWNFRPIVNCFVVPFEDISIVDNFDKNSNEIAATENNFSTLLNDSSVYVSKNFIIYPQRRRVKLNGEEIKLSQVEFELLLLFIENINDTISAEKIYEKIWNDKDLKMTSKTLKVHISNLRKKLNLTSENSIQLFYSPKKGYGLKITSSL